MQRLLMLVSVTCVCALQHAYVVQPRGGIPSMSVDPSFWQAKQARARYQMEKESSLLDELMEREQILMDQLLSAQQGGAVAVLPAADPSLQLELDQALAALTASEEQREIDVQKTGAYWLEEVKTLRAKMGAEAAPAAAEAAPTATDPNLQLELDQALTALAASEQQREIDVQKTAAYWLEEVKNLRGNMGAEAVPTAAVPTANDSSLQLELDQALAALTASEEQREIDVQKTAAYWLEEVKNLRGNMGAEAVPTAAVPTAADPSLQLELEQALAALTASEEQREIDVQKTAAYWLEEVKTLRGKLSAEAVPAAADAAPTAADPSSQLELEQALTALAASEQQREIDVQKTGAYWLSEVATLRGKLGTAEAAVEAASSATEQAAAVAWQEGVEAAAAEAARSEPLPSLTFQRVEGLVAGAAIALATGVASEGGGEAELRRQHEEQLEAAALVAESQLQSTSLFWVEKASALRIQAVASEARAVALEEALHARELRAELELQTSAAFWVKRVAALEARLEATAEAEVEAEAEAEAGVPAPEVVAEAVAVLAAEAARATEQAGDLSASTTEQPPKSKGWKPQWKTW